MTKSESIFSSNEQRFLLRFVRDVINTRLRHEEMPMPTDAEDTPVFQEKRGVFVTLKKNGQLRGCIGYPLPHKKLIEAVYDNALAAAFQDPRFPPLQSEELDEIHIEISVLSVPQKIVSPEEVMVGRDGIIISTSTNKGLLLPQVPLEQGWNRQQYLDYGCLKAGLPRDYWRSHPVRIETFQAQVFSEDEVDSRGE